MRVTVQNLSLNALSTDVGLLLAGESKTVDMGPDQAYRTAAQLKLLGSAVSVTVAEESALLDSLEPGTVTSPFVPADGSLTTAKYAALSVDTAALAAGAVTAAKIAAGAVNNSAIGNAQVMASKIAYFASAELTGTGSAQNLAHSLGAVPAIVMVSVTDDNSAAGFTVVEGAHDGTNVIVTVTTGAKFKVLAIR